MNPVCAIFGPVFSLFGSVFSLLQSAWGSIGFPEVGSFFTQVFQSLLSFAEGVSGCNFAG